jgi:hypothetical protein
VEAPDLTIETAAPAARAPRVGYVALFLLLPVLAVELLWLAALIYGASRLLT